MTIDEANKRFPDIIYAVSDTSDGNLSFKWGAHEEVVKNREAFLQNKGIHLGDCVITQPQHEDTIVIVEESDRGRGAFVPAEGVVAEAVITKEKGLILFLLTADCFPISYYDPKKNIVALAHLGWKPTEKKLAAKVVEKMAAEFGTDPRDLIAIIGPGIHKDSYALVNPQQKHSAKWGPFLEDAPRGKQRLI